MLIRHTIRSTVWMSSSSGAQSLLRLLGIVVLARLLDPDVFGLMGAALIVIALATLLFETIGAAIVQRSAIDDSHLRTAWTLSIAASLAATLLIVWSAPSIQDIFNFAELDSVLRVLSLSLPLYGLGTVSEAMLRRAMEFKALSIIHGVSYGLGYVTVSILLAWLGLGVWSLVFATILWRALFAILVMVRVRPPGLGFNRIALSDLALFGRGNVLARILNFGALQGDFIVAGRWLGETALGSYNRAYQLSVTPVRLLGTALEQVLFPAMSLRQSSQAKLREAFLRGISAIAFVVLPMSAVAVLLAPELVLMTLGPQWTDATVPFRLLAAGMFFRTGYKISDSLADATGAVFRRAWRHGVYAASVVGGAWVGQEIGGLEGLSLGVLGALIVNFSLMSNLSLKLTNSSASELLRVLGHPLILTAFVFTSTASVASLSRWVGASPIVTLLLSGLAALVPFAVVFRWPGALGADAAWLVDSITGNAKATSPTGGGAP